jgi:hypothetical protein
VAVAIQDDVNKEFARDVEAGVQKRGEDLIRPIGREGSGRGIAAATSLTPRVRNKRKRKVPEKREPPIKELKRRGRK